MLYPFRLEAPAQKQSPQRHLTHSKLFLISALVGLICLAGLMYRASTVSAQAAAGPVLEPARPAPAASDNAIQAQAQITAQATVTPLDVVVVFDISGSTEDQTICHDCSVRTSYNPDWPNNGYFNPLPYNPNWAGAGTGNHSIPQSGLCTVYPPQPFITNTYQYLTVEAELYSRNAGNWDLSVRTPGQGFWAVQRGSKVAGNNALGEDNEQRNAAGNPTLQSSNVCRPNIVGGPSLGIDCTVGTSSDDVCSSADGGIAADCSGYIAARPFNTYGQSPGNMPYLDGATYNADCFSGSALSGNCWSNNPFKNIPGLEVGPSNVPWVEYDFTPTWSGDTYIWIRAIGGNDYSFTYAGARPDEIQPDPDNDKTNNLTPWRKVIYWQVGNGTIFQRKDNLNADYSNLPADDNSGYFQRASGWRDNRAENARWRWIKLGSISTYGTQYTLRLYQGSAGYKVDKLVFTNDPNGTTNQGAVNASNLPAALLRNASGGTAAATDYGNQLGPPASLGSATREACNKCNPAYGYQIADPLNECTCRKNVNETGYGTGQGCTLVLTQTNMLQDQLETGLYSDLQPLRSAQEGVKHLARQLDPKLDQLGFVPFTSGSDNASAQATSTRRTKLQCLSWATQRLGDPARCYDPNLGIPISYTSVISAVEKQWPESGTDIASGIKEGLEELGVPGFAANSNCTATPNDGSACDRGSAARRVLILLTDSPPNANPGNCDGTNGRPDLWDGLIGTEDPNFECAMYYASLAAQNNVTLYTIGVGAGHSMDLLTAMATGIDPRGGYGDVKIFDAPCGQYNPTAKPTDLELVFDEYAVTRMRNCRPNAPGLVFTKTDSPDPVLAGGVLNYTLAVVNYGILSATGVIVTDTLDSRVSFVLASDGGLLNNGVVTWNVGTVAPNQAIARTLVVTVGNVMSGTVLGNTAGLTSNENISLSQAITTTVVDPPLPAPALTLTKVDLADPVLAGNRLTYNLNLANNGSATATGVILTDTLNNGVSFVTASDGGNFNNNLVTWNINSISPGQRIARTLVVTVNKSFTASLLSNTAWVAAAQGGSQSAAVTTTVTSTMGEQIWTLNYKVGQGSALAVHLENHFSQAGPYDIYLSLDGILDGSNDYLICSAVNTPPLTNSGDYSCPITVAVPPGFYTLFSTLMGSYAIVATAPQQVEVIAGSSPQLQIDNGTGGNIAAVNSYITLTLVAHQIADQPFDLFFVNPTDLTSLKIFNDVPAIPSSPLIWRVPGSLLSPSNPCPASGTTLCLIQSHDKNDQVYVSGEFYLNAPKIILGGNNMVYAAGETIYTMLQGHTPGLAYDLKFSDGLSNTVWLGRTSVANSIGNVVIPVGWTIPITWPNGIYTITSHPAAGSTPRDFASMTSANQIGSLSNVQINTPVPPTLTIEGGDTWPSDTSITISVHNHPDSNGAYYLQFGPWRVPTGAADDTFQTDATGSVTLNYHIPFTATAGVSKTFTISSFLASNNSVVATRSVTVLPPPPAITVLEGNTVLPGATITISLTNHAPNSAYQVIYANKILLELLTDSRGQSQRSYSLASLPASPPPDLSDPANQGVFFDLHSENLSNPGAVVAATTLALVPCTHPLKNRSFETIGDWVLASDQFVSYGPGGHTGNRQLLAHSFNGGYRTPNFYQPFTMPVSLLPTGLKLDFFFKLNNLADGDDFNDKYYAVVSTSPSPSAGLLTNPIEILNGDIPPRTLPYPPNTSYGWYQRNLLLPLAAGVTLQSYARQPLYLYVYNNSNTGCTPGVNCHASEFYFDDVNLAVCGPRIPALNLTQTDIPDPVKPGETLTYTLTVANKGLADATGVIMTDTLDSRTGFVSASAGGQHSAGVVTWNINTLSVSQTITRTLTVTVGHVASGTILSNTIRVISTEGISSSRIITTVVKASAPPISTYLPVILKQN